MLSSVLLSKLPPDMRLIVSRKVSADDLDMDCLLETFEQELIARESAAYDAIAGLALSAANYGEAVEILKKRFGNRQLIISKHMESLLSVNAVTSDNHLRDL